MTFPEERLVSLIHYLDSHTMTLDSAAIQQALTAHWELSARCVRQTAYLGQLTHLLFAHGVEIPEHVAQLHPDRQP